MKYPVKVLLITGPAGSGKTTLASYVADKLGWVNISEDDYWIKNGWSGIRTEEQELAVQEQVSDDLLQTLSENDGVVLEFILYKQPPNPLSNYQKFLTDNTVPFKTVVLKPSVAEIKKRLLERGRPNDIENIDDRMQDVSNQLSILEVASIDPAWVTDPTNMTVDDLYTKCLQQIGRQN